jgi:hypothetical protein
MTSGECFENKWFSYEIYREYLGAEILLTHECILMIVRVKCIDK